MELCRPTVFAFTYERKHKICLISSEYVLKQPNDFTVAPRVYANWGKMMVDAYAPAEPSNFFEYLRTLMDQLG